MLERHVCKVEMHSFQKHVGGYEYFSVRIFQYSRVIAYAFYCRAVFHRKILCKTVY